VKIKYYIVNALTGAFFGFLGYLIFIVSENRDYHSLWAIITSIVGFGIGTSSITFLQKKRPQIYYSPSLSVWTTLYINLNLFFGIFLGLGVGICASYILLLFFSAMFGHPESDVWRGGLWYVFISIALVVTAFSLLSFARSRFMFGIRYSERKYNT
jgi:hypothetical protein